MENTAWDEYQCSVEPPSEGTSNVPHFAEVRAQVVSLTEVVQSVFASLAEAMQEAAQEKEAAMAMLA